MTTTSVRRLRAPLTIGVAALLVAGGGVAALAGPAAGVAPAAHLCVADGKAVTAAVADGQGGYTCPSGRTLQVVAAQEAVRLLDASVASLQGQVNALSSRTAVTLRETGVPWASRPDGTIAPATFTVSCGPDGKALSGSAKTSGATVAQSHVSDGGSSWTFTIRATTTTPTAQAFVTCMGPTGGGGGTAPVPGGG